MDRTLSFLFLTGMVLPMSCAFPTREEGGGAPLPVKDTVWIDVHDAEILARPFLHTALLLMAAMERVPDSLQDTLALALQTLLEDPQVWVEMKTFMEEQDRARVLDTTAGQVCMDTVRGLPFSNEIFMIRLCIQPKITFRSGNTYGAKMTGRWSFGAFTVFGSNAYDYSGELILSMMSAYGSFGDQNPYHVRLNNLDLGQQTLCLRYGELAGETLGMIRSLVGARGLRAVLAILAYIALLLNDVSDTPAPWSVCGFRGDGRFSIQQIAHAFPSIPTWTRTLFHATLILNPHGYIFRVSAEIW